MGVKMTPIELSYLSTKGESQMAKSVKVSDEIFEEARSEAKAMKRSITGQVEYWVDLGRTLESSKALDLGQVRDVLKGRGTVHELTPAEDALYLELLGRELESLDGSDTTLIEELEAGHHPVSGEDADGNLTVRSTKPSGRSVD